MFLFSRLSSLLRDAAPCSTTMHTLSSPTRDRSVVLFASLSSFASSFLLPLRFFLGGADGYRHPADLSARLAFCSFLTFPPTRARRLCFPLYVPLFLLSLRFSLSSFSGVCTAHAGQSTRQEEEKDVRQMISTNGRLSFYRPKIITPAYMYLLLRACLFISVSICMYTMFAPLRA